MKLDPRASGAALLPALSVGRANTLYCSLSCQGTDAGVLQATEKPSEGARVVGIVLEASRTSQPSPSQYLESEPRLTRRVTWTTLPFVLNGISLAVPLRDGIWPAP